MTIRSDTKPLRALLGLLAASAALPGMWGALAPRSFYGSFPGAGHHWVDRAGPFSDHLITDVGAFYLAFALLLAWAALRPSRALVVPVALAWTLFSAIHLVFHATHLGGFPAGDAAAEIASLALVAAGGLAAAALARRQDDEGRPPGRPSR